MNTSNYYIGLPSDSGSLFWTGAKFTKHLEKARSYQSERGAKIAATRLSRDKRKYVVICGSRDRGDYALIADWWQQYRAANQKALNHNYPDRERDLTVEDFRTMPLRNTEARENHYQSSIFLLKGRECLVSVWHATYWRYAVYMEGKRVAYGNPYATRLSAESDARRLIEIMAE